MSSAILEQVATKPQSLRRLAGLAIAGIGALLLATRAFQELGLLLAQPAIMAALAAGAVAALATAAGALPVVLARSIGERTIDTLLGFGAGVMFAATAFSLVLPALAAAGELGLAHGTAVALVVAGIACGALALLTADRAMPHEHVEGSARAVGVASIDRVWLFVGAIAIHNIPEGLAIGVGFGQASSAGGTALASGIAAQNIPEGLVVAAALVAAGYGRPTAFAVAALSGLVEPVAAVLGAALVSLFATLLPWALAFAAGAMLFVVSHEIIPESHRRGHESQATAGLVAGFCMMLMLDAALR